MGRKARVCATLQLAPQPHTSTLPAYPDPDTVTGLLSWQPVRRCVRKLGYGYNYSKTFLTDHLHISSTPHIDRFNWIPNSCPYDTIVIIFRLSKPITSLSGSFKVGSMVGWFREVLLYMNSHSKMLNIWFQCLLIIELIYLLQNKPIVKTSWLIN